MTVPPTYETSRRPRDKTGFRDVAGKAAWIAASAHRARFCTSYASRGRTATRTTERLRTRGVGKIIVTTPDGELL